MFKVALTGGIATGKSHVASRLREAGVPVVDADVVARTVVARGTRALAAIARRFGAEILTPEGHLDRARLAEIVFRDEGARRDLEAIVHPEVRQAMDEFFQALPSDTPLAIADIPLLYETGGEKQFAKVIVAACPRAMQVERVMARDGVSREDAERRITAQWPIDDKVARGDYVIRTDGTFADTDAQIAAVLETLRRR